MREVTESLLRFTWAMSLLGARQVTNLLRPRQGWQRTSRELDALSRAAAHEMDETTRSVFQTGDRIQTGLFDSAARLARGGWSAPGKTLNEIWEALDRTRTAAREQFHREADRDDGDRDA